MKLLNVVSNSDLGADFDAFADEHRPHRGPVCRLCVVPADVLELVTRKRAEGHECSLISRYLRSKGHAIKENTVSRHFREGHGG